MVSNGFYHGLAVLQPDAHSRMVIIGREKAEVSSARRLEAAERPHRQTTWMLGRGSHTDGSRIAVVVPGEGRAVVRSRSNTRESTNLLLGVVHKLRLSWRLLWWSMAHGVVTAIRREC